MEEETQHALDKEKELEAVTADRECNLAMIGKLEETIVTLRREIDTLRQEHEVTLADHERLTGRLNADVKLTETKLLQSEQIIQTKTNQIRNLENDARDHQNRISDLNKSVDTLQMELDAKKRLLYDSSCTKEHDDKISELELEVRELRSKSATVQGEREMITDVETDRLKLEIEQLERERTGFMERIASYEEIIAQQKNDLIDEARRMTIEAISQLPGDVLQAERIRGLEEEILSLKCTVHKMEEAISSGEVKEVENTKERFEETERKLRQELELARDEFNRERGIFETKLLECRSLLDRKEKELVKALGQSNTDESSEVFVSNMEEKLKAMEISVRSLEAEVERKQSTILEHEKRLEEMKKESGQHERHYGLLQSNLEKTIATVEEKERLLEHQESKADQERERAETLHKELIHVQDDLVSLQMRLQEQSTEFEQRARETEAEKDRIEQRATRMQNDAGTLQLQVIELDGALERVNAKADQLDAKLKLEVESGSKKDEELLCLEKRLSSEREATVRLEKKLEATINEFKRKEEDFVSGDELALAEKRLAELCTLKEALNDDVVNLTLARKQLELEVKAKEERIQDLESKLSESSGEVSRTERRLADSEAELNSMKKAFEAVEHLTQGRKELESDVRAKDERIQDLASQLSELKESISRLEEQMRIASAEHEETDDRLLGSLRENRKLQMKIELYKKKVGRMRGGNNDDPTSTFSSASTDSPRSPVDAVAGSSAFKSTPTPSEGAPVEIIPVSSQGRTRSSGRLAARSEMAAGTVERESLTQTSRSVKRPAVGITSGEEAQNAKKVDVRSSPIKRKEAHILDVGKKRTPLHEQVNKNSSSSTEGRRTGKERGKKDEENQCGQQ